MQWQMRLKRTRHFLKLLYNTKKQIHKSEEKKMKNNKYYRVYAEINLDAIVKNVDNLMALTKENTGALAVVKADGYGHGDVAVAKAVAQK